MATLKVITGGTPEETALVIKETGEMIHGVVSFSYYVNVDTGVNEVIIRMYPIEVEVPPYKVEGGEEE